MPKIGTSKSSLIRQWLNEFPCFTSDGKVIFCQACNKEGWNDVGFHGSDQIPTPNIDALAYNGVILNSHYSSPLCSPSRAALLTGKYPIHNGMHQNLILEPEPWGLPLSERTIPQYFSPLGYTSHVVGKWHLGYFKKAYTPTRRGFTSHFGFYNGYQDYYSHNVQASFVPYEGFDMRRNMEIAYNTRGSYSTDLFTEEAVRVIREHNANEKSLFLLLSHLAPHAGNYENPLQAPAEEIARFKCIKNRERRIYAAMVSKLDESVGKVMQALFNKGILNNTIVVFLSDNGAPTRGIHPNHGSNWPLKGVKGTPWEGSSRTVALMWSFNLEKKKRISNQLMHITDWLPTLYSAAGGDMSKLRNLDGIDMWQSISRGYQAPRSRLLINIDPGNGYSALRSGKYKYINGTSLLGFLDHWSDKPGFGDSCPKYKLQEVLNSKAAKAISMLSGLTTKREVEALRRQATLNCTIPPAHVSSCQPLKQPCVFDVWQDPCETKNLYKSRPDIVKTLEDEMEEYKTTMVKPMNKRTDKFANPRYWNNTWTYWQDFPPPVKMEAERKSWCLVCY